MSKDFADDAGAYLDFPETNRYALIGHWMILRVLFYVRNLSGVIISEKYL